MGRSPCSDENGLKKGPWTPDEDKKLVEFMKKNGHASWRALPKLAGLNRCGKSCRLRWTNYLRPDIKRGKFSQHEEQTILHLHSFLGNKWSAIATHLPGRTDNEIKNFWNTHLKKKLIQMGFDPMTHLPRKDQFSSLVQLIVLAKLTEVLNQHPPLEEQAVLRLKPEAVQLVKLQCMQYLLNSYASMNSNSLLTAGITGIEAGLNMLNTVSLSMNENLISEINNPFNYPHRPDLQVVPSSLQGSPNSETGHGSNIATFNVQEERTPTSLRVPPQISSYATTAALQNEIFSFSNPNDACTASMNSNSLLTARIAGIEEGLDMLNTVSSPINENPISAINNPFNYSHQPDLQVVPRSLHSSPNNETGYGSNIIMFNVQEEKTPTSLWVPPPISGSATTAALQNEIFAFRNPSDACSATSSEGRVVSNFLWPELYLEDPFMHEIA